MHLSLISPTHTTPDAYQRALVASASGDRPNRRPRAAQFGTAAVEQVSDIYRRAGRVGIVDVAGVMEHQTSIWSRLYGGVPTPAIAAAIREAADDASVSAIMLDIDSPGGDVAGMDDLEQAMAYARSRKFTAAMVHDTCCSAAYWMASQANEIVATPTAIAGSIGVLLGPIVDASKAMESQGVVVHYVASGDLKAPGGLGQAVTDEQLQNLAAVVESLFARFVRAVSSGRRISEDAIRAMRGGVFAGAMLTSNGLVDRVVSYHDFTSGLLLRAERGLKASSPSAGRVPGSVSQASTQGDTAMAITPEQWSGIDVDALTTNRPDLVKSIEDKIAAKTVEPPASAKALREAFPGDPEFALSAIERGLTLIAARAEYCDVLKARLAELNASATAAASRAADDARRLIGATTTVEPSALGIDGQKRSDKGFWDRVEDLMEKGKSKAEAITEVREKYPNLPMLKRA